MLAASPVRRSLSALSGLLLVLLTFGMAGPVAAAPGASTTATVTSQSPEGLTVSVSGAGFSTDGPGVYTGLRVSGASSDLAMKYSVVLARLGLI